MRAVEVLWRMPRTENLRSTSAFKWFSKTVQTDYPSAHSRETQTLDFALERALRALGLPYQLPLERGDAHVPSQEAARLLDRAIRATRCRRRHLVPLDRAAVLPDLTFGPVRLGKLSETHLRELVNATRLERLFPDLPFDVRLLSMFQWLVVEEELALDPNPAARASPFLFETTTVRDFGQVEPHKGRFPPAVEKALFAVLLAPWEEWSTKEPDWRGFRAPWVYTVDEDIFAPCQPPRSAETLTWESYDDQFGEHIEFFRPWLDGDATRRGVAVFDDAHWSAVERALGSPLFETPVAHFFVRAFLSEGIDEFLAHLTTIEAALGLQSDCCPKLRPKPDRHKRLEATGRLRGRIVALLEDSCAADLHKRLFDLRSCYLHGRPMKPISTKDRTEARKLARRVAEALVKQANEVSAPSSREEFLNCLLRSEY